MRSMILLTELFFSRLNIAYQLKKITVSIYQYGFVATTEKLTFQLMAAVEPLRIDSVYVPHDARYIAFRCMNQHVVMVGHQAISGYTYIPCLGCFLKQFNKRFVIEFVKINVFGSAASVHDVIPGTWIGYSDWARHAYFLADNPGMSQE